MLHPFLYYLVEADGRVRQIVNGNVVSQALKVPLVNTPDGWQDILIKWARNRERHGQVREFSLPLKFVRDGAKILRNDMYRTNIDRELYLIIQRLTNSIDAVNFFQRYDFLYKGQLDFSSFNDQPGDSIVTINIMEGGISKLVKANENTEFLIPFDNDAINIFMTGAKFFQTVKYLLPGLDLSSSEGTFSWVPFSLISQEVLNPNIAFFTQSYEDHSGASDPNIFNTSQNFILEAVIPTTVHLKGTFNFYTENFAQIQLVGHWDSGDITTPGEHSIPIDIDINLIAGEHLFLTLTHVGAFSWRDSNFTFTFDYTFKSTIIKAFKPIDVFKKLCAKLGITLTSVFSTLLESCTFMLTCGDAIRGLTGDTVGVKTSLNQFLRAYDIMLFAGMDITSGINGIIEIEGRLKYYNITDPTLLGETKNFDIAPATDMIFSSITFGWKEQEVDDVNGKFDFNGQLFYTTPVQAGGGKKLEMISDYKAGPYEIEIIRQNLEGKTTTDASSDNQVFVIDVGAALNQDEVVTVSFLEGTPSLMITPLGLNLIAGQKIRITGSVNNDRDYTILGVAESFVGDFVALDQPVVTEGPVSVLLQVLGGALYNLDRSVVPDAPTFDTDGITILTGVPDPGSIFNVRLRPAALLAKHYRWIRSWLYNFEPGIVKYDHANRNGKLVVGGLVDGRDVAIGAMGALIFKPYYFDFTTRVPIDMVEELTDNPSKAFTPTWNGDNYPGFLIDGGLAPNTLQPQTFKLLCGPETDLLNLIR